MAKPFRPIASTLVFLLLALSACSAAGQATPTVELPPTPSEVPPTLAPSDTPDQPTNPPTTQAPTIIAAPTNTVIPSPAGATATSLPEPTLIATSANLPTTLDGFREALLNAVVEDRSAANLFAYMGESFTIHRWPSQADTYPSTQAATVLQVDYLPQLGDITYDWGMDLSPKLGGTDPLSLWGDDVAAVDASIMSGWGRDGKGQAILIIAEKPEGDGYYWHAVIFDADGF